MGNVYSVSKINSYIKGIFGEDFLLGDVEVKGEISNLKYHSSGHIYFTLKDEKSALPGVMFAGNSMTGLKFIMNIGDSVIVRGNIDVYERDGKYQIYARSIKKDGEGRLYEEFLKLKEELEESGMFAPEYKKEIPGSIRKLGIVTAETGAAVRDIINISKRRNPYIEILLYPAIVQGEYAVPSIVKGIRKLNETDVDVIIVGRGGGSIEDLWAFNEREVAEAIFNSSKPIISAVGHETDTTIADFVADLRAPTPSAAAELAVNDVSEDLRRIGSYEDFLRRSMERKIRDSRQRTRILEDALRLRSPERKLKDERVRLMNLEDSINSLMKGRLNESRHMLSIYIERLKGLSPLDKLNQGYSYTEHNGKTLKSIDDVSKNDEINIFLRDGVVTGCVTGKNRITYGE